MFAVVVRETGEQAQQDKSGPHLEKNVAPRVRQAPGFVSALWMTDRAGGALSILVFESEEAARGALEAAKNAPRPAYMSVVSADVYEVLARA